MRRKLSYNDPAGDMAKAQLQKIEMYAAKLNDMIHPDDELEPWVQSKLARVSTDMGDVKHYLDYELKKMGHGGQTDEGINLFQVGFKYEKEDEEDDDDDKDIVRIVDVYASCKDEAEKIVSEKYGPYYDDFEFVEIEQKDEDELLGMQPEYDMLEMSASQYYKDGGTLLPIDLNYISYEVFEKGSTIFRYYNKNMEVIFERHFILYSIPEAKELFIEELNNFLEMQNEK
jgi:hypothetical protein